MREDDDSSLVYIAQEGCFERRAPLTLRAEDEMPAPTINEDLLKSCIYLFQFLVALSPMRFEAESSRFLERHFA
jgi:hypothetical protein